MQNPFKISNFAGKFQSFSRGKWKIKDLKNYRIKERGEIMKISLLKLSRKKEVIKRIELSEVAEITLNFSGTHWSSTFFGALSYPI